MKVYRSDIDGLRALAVGTVLLFHAGISWTPGGFVGVDVFFVISGYLISGILFSEITRTGRIDFLNFWARRTRRLMPSAIFVIAVSLIVGWFFLSELQMYYAGRDAIYATTYLTNWQKLFASIDYFDDESGAGLFIHYWSLAVEEQFYLFLSVIFGIVSLISAKFKDNASKVWLISVVIFSCSLISFFANLWSIGEAQPIAFFGTHARIWQLGLGVGVCLLERSGFRPSTLFREFSAWLGTGLVLVAVALFDEKLIYPGIYAAVPTLGAALFILAGVNYDDDAKRPRPLLLASTAIPIAIGKISYALYLWHWPVFEFHKIFMGSWETPDKIVAILVTLLLAIASYFLVENPVRFSHRLIARPGKSLAAAVAITITTCAIAAAIVAETSKGKIVLADGSAYDPRAVRRDLPRIYKERCHADQKKTIPEKCIYGHPGSDKKIFLIGDSHAAHWFPPLEEFANEFGYALYNRTKSACIGINIETFNRQWKRLYHECEAWRNAVYEEIIQQKPALVVMGNSSAHRVFLPDVGRLAADDENKRLLVESEKNTVRRLLDAGTKVALMVDMPWFKEDPVDCLLSNPGKTNVCRWLREVSYRKSRSPWSNGEVDWGENVAFLDFSDAACWDNYCYAASASFPNFRDRHHITTALASSLSPGFSKALGALLNNR